eukprot:CAMPEP_0117615116 /NCGR_PEP_ID=MMETSP0784-20121206/84379_1 /TAXON_ID=39447 /ORGANISM="" /LENGTH=363 /DNA_ID=CAMNT_0005418853 /DNA_START=156 /DNA_END=1247 /DNA_ORIENTATION=-
MGLKLRPPVTALADASPQVGGNAAPGSPVPLGDPSVEKTTVSTKETIGSANRNAESRIRRSLVDLKYIGEGRCVGTLPTLKFGHRSDMEVDSRLATVFPEASHVLPSETEEAVKEATANAGDATAHCSEATYGEIRVSGLRRALGALARLHVAAANVDAELTSKAMPSLVQNPASPPFQAFVDLGAGIGRTAAAAVLLGFASQAFGVEFWPKRFAIGCRALANASIAANADRLVKTATLEAPRLVREWPTSAARAGGWPCGPQWAFFVGAQCFRDAILASVGRALAEVCDVGTHVAVLGRRFPAEVTEATAANNIGIDHANAAGGRSRATQLRKRYLQERGSLLAATTWSRAAEVFLYDVAPR